MQPADIIQEHIRLIRILSQGTKKEQHKEAKKQAKELKEMLVKVRKDESRK
jgi:hypothetical protein